MDSVGADWLTGDSKLKSGRGLDGAPDGVKGVLITGAHGDSKGRAAARCAGSHLSRKRVRPSCMS